MSDRRATVWRLPAAAFLFMLLAAGCARGQEAGPVFVVHTADGKNHSGPLAEIGPDWSVQLGGTQPVRVSGAEVVCLRRPRLPLPARPGGEQLVFANGDCLPGIVLGIRGEKVQVRAFDRDGPELQVPLSALSVLWLAAPQTKPAPDLFLRELAHESRRRDIVHLRNGDVLTGVVLGMERDGNVPLQVERRRTSVPASKVAALAFNTRLARLRLPPGPYGHLILANGTRLAVTSAMVQGNHLQCRTLFGQTLSLPVYEVRALDIYQGPAAYLSELRPRTYKFHSYLGSEHVTYVPDGSVLPGAAFGGMLSLRKSHFDRGLGMAGASRLSYTLDGRARWFEATVGLDDTGRHGSAQIAVLVDGRPQALGWDGKLTWQGGPHAIRLSVVGAHELTLVVDFGERGNVRERVDWADARLLR